MLDPLGEYDKVRGSRPQDDTGFFFSETRHNVCTGCAGQTTSCSTGRPKLTAKRRRVDKAQNDGLCQQTENNRDDVHRLADRHAMME